MIYYLILQFRLSQLSEKIQEQINRLLQKVPVLLPVPSLHLYYCPSYYDTAFKPPKISKRAYKLYRCSKLQVHFLPNPKTRPLRIIYNYLIYAKFLTYSGAVSASILNERTKEISNLALIFSNLVRKFSKPSRSSPSTILNNPSTKILVMS